MKFTLSDCMQRINQILNYPSVSYEDISHFFDQAMTELNTILKVKLPLVSEMVYDNTMDISLQSNTVLLDNRLTTSTRIQTLTKSPIDLGLKPGDLYTTEDTVEEITVPKFVFYASSVKIGETESGDDIKDTTGLDRMYYVWNGSSWTPYLTLYGVAFDGAQKYTYIAAAFGINAVWVESPAQRTLDFDLCNYMPIDWWILFVIPYVCFKFAVRNGDDGALYSTEFTEGLQQLQTCYDVPNFVKLSDVAGTVGYTEIVKKNLNNLNKTIPTRVITEDMRVGNAIQAIFGSDFDRGGWGI